MSAQGYRACIPFLIISSSTAVPRALLSPHFGVLLPLVHNSHPRVMLGRCMASLIAQRHLGGCSETLRMSHRWVQAHCQCSPAPLQLRLPNEDALSDVCSTDNVWQLLLQGWGQQEVLLGHWAPLDPVAGGSPAQTAEQGMQAAASSCPCSLLCWDLPSPAVRLSCRALC